MITYVVKSGRQRNVYEYDIRCENCKSMFTTRSNLLPTNCPHCSIRIKTSGKAEINHQDNNRNKQDHNRSRKLRKNDKRRKRKK